MSGHGHHDTGADSHAGHDDYHDETSSDDFPADEPRSPGWLPLLGGALFLAAIFAFVVLGGDDKPAQGEPAAIAAPTATPAPRAALPAIRPVAPLRAPSTLPH